MNSAYRYLLQIVVLTATIVNCFKHHSNDRAFSCLGELQIQRRSMVCYADPLDARELTKIFGRFAAKTILLDIPGAGTPEMASCCHGGCDNCNYSHVFDSLSAGRAKWVPTYSTRTLIDGRYEKAPWASIFDLSETVGETEISLDRVTFIERLQQLPYSMTMGPGASVPADEAPLEDAVGSFWDILIAAVAEGEGEVMADSLTADQMAKAMAKLTGQPHGTMWMDFKKTFVTA